MELGKLPDTELREVVMLLERKYSYPDAVAEIRNRLAPADEIRARHRWVAVTAHIALTAPAIPAGPNWT